MNRSVGLVIVTNSSSEGLKVALQRRGVQDSFPGACQVTVHGKLEYGENFESALEREMQEELGTMFAKKLRKDVRIVKLVNEKNDTGEIVTYGAMITESMLNLIRLERTSGGIDYVSGSIFSKGEVIEITPDKKSAGYPPSVRAMFADKILAVKKALEIFGK